MGIVSFFYEKNYSFILKLSSTMERLISMRIREGISLKKGLLLVVSLFMIGILVFGIQIGVLGEVRTSSTEAAPTEAKKPSTFELDGALYEKVVSEKFSTYIDSAHQYEAELYALPNSDCFVIVKDQEVIFSMSTGIKTVQMRHSSLLMKVLETSGEMEKYPELLNHLVKVNETGKPITVTQDEYSGYTIYVEDDWLVFSH